MCNIICISYFSYSCQMHRRKEGSGLNFGLGHIPYEGEVLVADIEEVDYIASAVRKQRDGWLCPLPPLLLRILSRPPAYAMAPPTFRRTLSTSISLI